MGAMPSESRDPPLRSSYEEDVIREILVTFQRKTDPHTLRPNGCCGGIVVGKLRSSYSVSNRFAGAPVFDLPILGSIQAKQTSQVEW